MHKVPCDVQNRKHPCCCLVPHMIFETTNDIVICFNTLSLRLRFKPSARHDLKHPRAASCVVVLMFILNEGKTVCVSFRRLREEGTKKVNLRASLTHSPGYMIIMIVKIISSAFHVGPIASFVLGAIYQPGRSLPSTMTLIMLAGRIMWSTNFSRKGRATCTSRLSIALNTSRFDPPKL